MQDERGPNKNKTKDSIVEKLPQNIFLSVVIFLITVCVCCTSFFEIGIK